MTKTQRPSGIHKAFYRNGQSHRDGADVSFNDIVKIFGFRGATVGAWVTKQEQQIAANLFFDALCDLMDILQVPESVISLNGSLAIAFGAGGQRYASAHYNSAKRELALAKNAGGGSLAHEWLHAFDHYICEHSFAQYSPNGFASEYWLNELSEPVDHPLNQKLFSIFEAVFISGPLKSPSMLIQNSIAMDKKTKHFYYARPQEVLARAFESTIQNHHIKNSFLVSGTKQSQEAKAGLYPDESALQLIAPCVHDYFVTLGRAIVRKPLKP